MSEQTPAPKTRQPVESSTPTAPANAETPRLNTGDDGIRSTTTVADAFDAGTLSTTLPSGIEACSPTLRPDPSAAPVSVGASASTTVAAATTCTLNEVVAEPARDDPLADVVTWTIERLPVPD